MAVTEGQVKIILRWAHIILGLVIMCYIYSPFHKFTGFQSFVKFFALPVIVFTGIWIWKFKEFNKIFGVRRKKD